MKQEYIKTSDAIIDKNGTVIIGPTYRPLTAADRLERGVAEVEKDNLNKKKKEPLNLKLLVGLKQPI